MTNKQINNRLAHLHKSILDTQKEMSRYEIGSYDWKWCSKSLEFLNEKFRELRRNKENK